MNFKTTIQILLGKAETKYYQNDRINKSLRFQIMPPILDLVHDSRLETRFADDGTTIHTFSEPNGVHRRIHREEYWKRERCLGHGGYGQVYLEKCIAGKRRGSIRAVKVIYGQSHSFKPMAFNRELEAITKFSHDRVGQASSEDVVMI